jgi:acyl-CoA reductase-like NAD-dependent aldehyde dehydrogenase
VILGEDAVDNWPEYIDLIVESICANGGRACVNASAVWTPRHGREIAEAMAEKMARIKPRAWDDPDAELSAFANPDIAERISGMIDGLLATPGAEDLVLKHRGTQRLYKEGRCAWLQPSVVLCDSPQHPLANKEFLFPYASVVEADQDEVLELIGPTLVGSVITEDPAFIDKLLCCRNIERLNVGPLRTNILMWDQPHEGNLFTHLYKQRAFAQAPLKRLATV